jgi:hypothetical protein
VQLREFRYEYEGRTNKKQTYEHATENGDDERAK